MALNLSRWEGPQGHSDSELALLVKFVLPNKEYVSGLATSVKRSASRQCATQDFTNIYKYIQVYVHYLQMMHVDKLIGK